MRFFVGLAFAIAIPSTQAQASDQYACSTNPGAKVKSTSVAIDANGSLFQGITKDVGGKVFEVGGVLSDRAAVSKIELTKYNVLNLYNHLISVANEALSEIQKENRFLRSQGREEETLPEYGCVGSASGTSVCSSSVGTTYENTFGSIHTYKLGETGEWIKVADKNNVIVQARDARREERAKMRSERNEANFKKLDGYTKKLEEEAKAHEKAREDALRNERPGDRIARLTTRPDQYETAAMQPGNQVDRIPQGHEISQPPDQDQIEAMKPGNNVPPKVGSRVGPRMGENIGRPGIITFNATLDTATGHIVRLVYRDGQGSLTEVILDPRKPVQGYNPIAAKVEALLPKAKHYAQCCRQDSKASCDQKVDLASREQLMPIEQEDESDGCAGASPFESGKYATCTTSRPPKRAPGTVPASGTVVPALGSTPTPGTTR